MITSLKYKLLALVLSAFVMSGCISGQPEEDTYVSASGKVTEINSDRENCVDSCNADYNRCQDSGAAHRESFRDGPSDMVGANADCRASLKACLPKCKSR